MNPAGRTEHLSTGSNLVKNSAKKKASLHSFLSSQIFLKKFEVRSMFVSKIFSLWQNIFMTPYFIFYFFLFLFFIKKNHSEELFFFFATKLKLDRKNVIQKMCTFFVTKSGRKMTLFWVKKRPFFGGQKGRKSASAGYTMTDQTRRFIYCLVYGYPPKKGSKKVPVTNSWFRNHELWQLFRLTFCVPFF